MLESEWRRYLDANPDHWWREGVLYQIYPRSFADSDGDGVGDLRGIVEKLDHLSWLGIDGIWLNPTMASPNQDWGYDVVDYCSVHPEVGTMEDLDLLIHKAGERGIRVLLDLVPNHTSDRHAWFSDARSSRQARHRDWYVWADPKPDGSPPNNWRSAFGGPAWTLEDTTQQYYLHNFLATMPDLNWWNSEVREAFEEIQRFWYDRGVAGFRIDVAHGIVKDRELRDNPPATESDHWTIRRQGQQPMYNFNRPEVHDVLRDWRQLADSQEPSRVLVGETFVLDLDTLATYYGVKDELHLAFNFPFIFADFESSQLRLIVRKVEELLAEPAWPVYAGSNHDQGRLASRWGGGGEPGTRCALMMLLTLRGTPFLYYGDEIGLPEVAVAPDQVQDEVGRRAMAAHGEARPGRDPERTPMHWNAAPGAGFTQPEARPWLPLGNYRACNVADQQHGDSLLIFTRDLIALRRAERELRTGAYQELPSPEGTWAWARGDHLLIALNLSGQESEIDAAGQVLLGTRRDREGEKVAGRLLLAPWEGAVIARA